jgi:hypothetical protein
MNEGLEKMISEQLMILGNQFDLEGSDLDFLGASLRTLAKASREEVLTQTIQKMEEFTIPCERYVFTYQQCLDDLKKVLNELRNPPTL